MNRRPKSRESESGFSLVEILVASLLMILSVFSVLALFPQALNSTRKSGHSTALNHLAAQQSYHLRALGFAHSDLSLGIHPVQQTDSFGRRYYPVTGFPEQFSLRWIVQTGPTDASGVADSKLRTVIIEATHDVRYDSGGNPTANPGARLVRYQTFVAQ